MIKIIANGKEKVFKQRCNYCSTDFTYMFDDTATYENDNARVPSYAREIICPVCNEKNIAIFSTENEPLPIYPIYPNYTI